MNREIKFRAWVTCNKGDWHGCDNYDEFDWDNRMRDVNSMYFPLDCFSGKDISLEEIECEGEDNYANGWTAFKECELMQYTGLKDKNGKEIYEGDVIKRHKCDMINEFTGLVKFEHVRFTAECINGGVHDALDFLPKLIEVIGNAYENPELLEKKVL
tara:strand:+ start:95 stop:565 length:471 start_codon:yes stop_codon:yes gene_type:complete